MSQLVHVCYAISSCITQYTVYKYIYTGSSTGRGVVVFSVPADTEQWHGYNETQSDYWEQHTTCGDKYIHDACRCVVVNLVNELN